MDNRSEMKELNKKKRLRRKCEMRTALLGALASDKRLEILELLRGGGLREQEIAERLGISQSAISRHLQCLRRAGVVSVRHEGIRRLYALFDPKILDLLEDTDKLLRAIWVTEKQGTTTHEGEVDSPDVKAKGNHND
ncbi:MAG: metalloregulator ArsR/SmtB family transcription factor [Bacteroidota bacterium]